MNTIKELKMMAKLGRPRDAMAELRQRVEKERAALSLASIPSHAMDCQGVLDELYMAIGEISAHTLRELVETKCSLPVGAESLFVGYGTIEGIWYVPTTTVHSPSALHQDYRSVRIFQHGVWTFAGDGEDDEAFPVGKDISSLPAYSADLFWPGLDWQVKEDAEHPTNVDGCSKCMGEAE